MFLVVNWARHVRDCGPGDWRTCDHCGNHGRWRRVEVANRLTVFFVPLISVGRARWEVCSVCDRGYSRD